ncbi:MAG: cohesin domain-containing protein, partial [Bacteroidota bacterium]
MRNTLKSFILIISSFCLLMITHRASAQSQIVDIVPNPVNNVVNPGDNFSVVMQVQTNGQAVAGAEIHLDFDPSLVEVVSLSPGTSLPIPLQNTSDNTNGTIDYAAGTFGAAVSTDFTLVTINFLAKNVIGSNTPVYGTVFPRQTQASFLGQTVLDEAIPFTISVVNPCNLSTSGLQVSGCNDGGTPSDPSDDTFSFSIDPGGNALGSGYTVSGDVSGGGTYGNVNTFSGLVAGGGDLTVTVTDNDDSNCSITFTVTDPGSCSGACNLSDAGLSNVQCNDNGTPSDPSDDFITFSLNPNGNNLGATYSVSGDLSLNSLSYGQSNFVTQAGTAGQGDLSITLTDANDPACQLVVNISDPGTCSNSCAITASGLSNISCDDNGTPSDPSDDFITFDLDPVGFNLGSGYTVSGASGTGTYGGVSSFATASGTAGNGDLNISITDNSNGGCTFGELLTDPGSCSNQCALTSAGLSNIQCNDNGTPSDPSDDFFTFELAPSGNALGASYALSAGISPTSAPYGSATQFSSAPGTAGNGDLSISLTDNVDGGCTISLSVSDPGTCSAQCLIADLGLSNIQCNDNGTDGDTSDDFITFELNPTGNALGSTYSLSAGISPASGFYGGATQFSTAPGTAGAGDLNITVTDDDDNGCSETAVITDPGSCSNANALSFIIGSGGGITCGSIFIPITVQNYVDILGGQGSITWDPTVATLLNTSDYGVPDLTPGSLNISAGQLNFSYNDNSPAQLGHSLTDGDTLILLEFDISGGVLGGTSAVEFSTTVPALFFDTNLSALNPLAVPGTIS